MQVEKENPNLITVFICFLRSGLRFTRYDTNNVGLAFIEEIRKHNPNFKPVKVQQRERDQIYTVNAYPKEFESLIMSLIEEYRIKHKMEYRLKKPRGGGRGGPNRTGRPGGQYRDNRGSGGYSRQRRDDQGGGYGQRGEGHRPRRNYDDQQGQGGYRPKRENHEGGYGQRREGNSNREGGYRPRRDSGSSRDGHNSGNRKENFENKRPRRPRTDSSE